MSSRECLFDGSPGDRTTLHDLLYKLSVERGNAFWERIFDGVLMRPTVTVRVNDCNYTQTEFDVPLIPADQVTIFLDPSGL